MSAVTDGRFDPAEHGLRGKAGYAGRSTFNTTAREGGYVRRERREPLFRVNGKWLTAADAAAELRNTKTSLVLVKGGAR